MTRGGARGIHSTREFGARIRAESAYRASRRQRGRSKHEKHEHGQRARAGAARAVDSRTRLVSTRERVKREFVKLAAAGGAQAGATHSTGESAGMGRPGGAGSDGSRASMAPAEAPPASPPAACEPPAAFRVPSPPAHTSRPRPRVCSTGVESPLHASAVRAPSPEGRQAPPPRRAPGRLPDCGPQPGQPQATPSDAALPRRTPKPRARRLQSAVVAGRGTPGRRRP